jgi:hypothetical protein
MRCHVSYSVLALALVIGASTAHAQTWIGSQYGSQYVGQPVGPVVAAPAATVVQPTETIQTIETIRGRCAWRRCGRCAAKS